MIRGFFDESHEGETFLIAGWVTDYKTWERFTEDWRTILDSEPAIRYFKHHEAKSNPPSGEFAGWTPEQIEAKIAALVSVICRHEMYGVATGLNTTTHATAFSGAIASRKQLRSVLKVIHYHQWCVFSVNAAVLQIQIEGGHTEIVDFVFDTMGGLLAECVSLYGDFKQNYPFPPDMKAIAGSMTEADDKQVEALQAADLLAGQMTTKLRLGHPEEHYQRISKAHKIFSTPAYLPSFEKIPDLISYFNVVWSTMALSRAALKDTGVEPKD